MTTTNETDSSAPSTPAPKSRSFRRRVLSRISIQSKLLAMLLVTSVLVGRRRRSHRLPIRTVIIARLGIRPADRDSCFTDASIGRPVLRSEEFARHIHPRRHHDRSRQGFHSRLRPAQRFDDQPGPMAVGRRLLQQTIRERQRKTRPATGWRSPRFCRGPIHRSICRRTTPRRSTTGTRRSRSTMRGTAAHGRRPTHSSTISSGRSSSASSSRMRFCSTPAATSSTPPTRASISAPTSSPARTGTAS